MYIDNCNDMLQIMWGEKVADLYQYITRCIHTHTKEKYINKFLEYFSSVQLIKVSKCIGKIQGQLLIFDTISLHIQKEMNCSHRYPFYLHFTLAVLLFPTGHFCRVDVILSGTRKLFFAFYLNFC